MVSALEAALQAQGSKHATLLQQLQLELKEAVGKAAQAHVRTGAVEAALQEQAAALAAAVAELTDKASLAQVCCGEGAGLRGRTAWSGAVPAGLLV
jgi:hypothetical protein